MANLSSGDLYGTTVHLTTADVTRQSLSTPIMAVESDVTPADTTTSDLLQQAMNEVSFDVGNQVSYVEHGGEVVYVREHRKLVSFDGMIVSGDMAVISDPQTAGVVVCGDQHKPVAMDVSGVLYNAENSGVPCEYMSSHAGLVNEVTSDTMNCNNSEQSAYSGTDVGMSQSACPVEVINSDHISVAGQNNAESMPSSAVQTDSAPLGSSRNPIRIIQRGNQYTALQHLTPDQLTQILQVIQEQQQKLAQSKNLSSSSSAILYNPDAGSQIAYHITNSSNSDGVDDSNNKTLVHMVANAEYAHQKRTVHKRRKDDEDHAVGNELSQQEKEERKKHRPRTRSGRVSKPPQYMVKDYKHIHPVDYDEDYDDSDGGYSDFKHSGDEEDIEDQQSKDDSLSDVDRSGMFAVCI